MNYWEAGALFLGVMLVVAMAINELDIPAPVAYVLYGIAWSMAAWIFIMSWSYE